MLHATQGVLLLAAYALTSLLIFSALVFEPCYASFVEHNLSVVFLLELCCLHCYHINLSPLQNCFNFELCLYFFINDNLTYGSVLGGEMSSVINRTWYFHLLDFLVFLFQISKIFLLFSFQNGKWRYRIDIVYYCIN